MRTCLHTIQQSLFAALLLCLASFAVAGVQVHDVVLANSDALDANDSSDHIGTRNIHLSVMGRDLVLQLKPSRFNRVARQYNDTAKQTLLLYEGTIEGDANSWARVSLHEGNISGTLYHYGKLLQLESRDYINDLLINNSGHTPLVLIENDTAIDAEPLLTDVISGTDSLSYAPTDQLAESRSQAYDRLKGSAMSNRDALGTRVTRALRIGIVVDSRFNDAHQSRGLARALGIINAVDAIYQSQLGIAIIVEGIRVYDDPDTDPMRNHGGGIGQLLESFRAIRMADERLANDLTLVHLFSGHRDPGGAMGLGKVNAACRLDGYDLSLSTPLPFDTLLAAHEIAHNLGAIHDDAAHCNVDVNRQSNTLMWPRLSGNSTAQFSNCSKRDMQAAINASCNLDNIDVAIAIRTYPTSEFLRRSVVIEVDNPDSFGRIAELTSITTFPNGTHFSDMSAGCTVKNKEVTCVHGNVQAGTRSLASITATLVSHSQENVTSRVELINATDVTISDNRTTVQLLQPDESTSADIAASDQSFINHDNVTAGANDAVIHTGGLSIGWLFVLAWCRLNWRDGRKELGTRFEC